MTNRAFLALALLSTFACRDQSREVGETGSAVAPAGETEAPTALNRDYRPVAENVVARNAGVKQGELVLIFGSQDDLPLLEDIAVEVRKRGADPLVSVGTQRLNRRMYDEVPAQYDKQTPGMMMKLADVVDVIIFTESDEGRTLKGVPPTRIAARGQAFAPVTKLMQQRGVRSVALGNGLYPTAERAEQFDVSREELADMMYGGMDVDYQQLRATGEQVRALLASGKELHITNPNGTDLKVGISGRPVYINDGIISPEDRKQRRGATSVWLPAGEVYLIPVPGSGNGTMVADEYIYQGETIKGLKLEFKGGKLTSMTADEGLEPLQAAYQAAGPGKDMLSVIDIGINPGIKSPEGSPLHVWAKAGTVTVSVGGNTWAGGDNQTSFGLPAYSPGTSVMVDGKPLVQNGKLVLGKSVAHR
jgi:aminopeptidase